MPKNNEVIEINKGDLQPQSLIAIALQQNQPIEVLERLMALEERHHANKAKIAYYENLSKLQAAMPDLLKLKKVNYPSKSGGAVKYNYTPLGIIIKNLKPYLLKYGFSYRFEFEEIETTHKIRCYCKITHKDGHTESTFMDAAKDVTGNKNDIQSIGSSRTYLQRYTLVAGFGLTTVDTDDDGISAPEQNKEVIPEPKKKATHPTQPVKPDIIHDRGNEVVLKEIQEAASVIALEAVWKKMKPDIQKQYAAIIKTKKIELLKTAVDNGNPNLTDVTWHIQNIESATNIIDLESFMGEAAVVMARSKFKNADKSLIERVYLTQHKKISEGK